MRKRSYRSLFLLLGLTFLMATGCAAGSAEKAEEATTRKNRATQTASEETAGETDGKEPSGKESTEVPETAPAAETAETESLSEDNAQADMPKVGSTVFFGAYEQDGDTGNGPEPIEWIVLETTEDRTLLFSLLALDVRSYHSAYEEITWEGCPLRTWLNEDFYHAAFTAEDQERILTVTNPADPNTAYGTSAGNDTQDNVFLLSSTEFLRYVPEKYWDSSYSVYAGDQFLAAKSNGVLTPHCAYWLRTPGEKGDKAVFITIGSQLDEGGTWVNQTIFVRPAVWISR